MKAIAKDAAFRLAMDIGGTFTDFIVMDEKTGRITLEKTPTTPHDLWQGIQTGIGLAGLDLNNASMISHGTTVGLNSFLERKGATTGLITTRGFRDVYEIGRHNRLNQYDLYYTKPEPLVPREHRIEVTERLDYEGNVLEPLSRDDVIKAAEHFRAHGISTIAVVLLHSYANPVHEIAVADILAEVYPEATVSLSHQLAREWREYERTSTTVINAYISRRVGDYLDRVESKLTELGYKHPFFVNQSSGGIMSVASARQKPVQTIMSGPAGGAVSAAFIGKLMGYENVIGFDMGGTSTDVSLTYQGNTRVTVESQIDRHPLLVPMVDIRSIGAGGGSIGWVDRTGALTVGPQSAGADPGPACYGRGGTQPTVTDANLVLGRVPNKLLGGAMGLDEAAAREAVRQVTEPLGLDPVAGAAGMIRIVTSMMAYAIRAVTVQRGLDPKDFALVAFGGAGPIHACEIADEIGVPTVIVPIAPGAFSALGMIMSNVRRDLVRTRLIRSDEADPAELESIFADMEEEARQTLAAEVKDAPVVLERYVDMRYVGQEYTVSVPMPQGPISAETLAEVRAEFDRLHDQAYGHSSSTEPTEMINTRLVAFGILAEATLEQLPEGGPEPAAEAIVGTTELCLDAQAGYVSAPVYDRAKLLAGNRFSGPALIAEKGATTVLIPGYTCSVDKYGNLVISKEG